MKSYFLPSLMLILALISLSTLKSIAPELAQQQLFFWLVAFTIFFLIKKINFSYLFRLAPIFYLLLLALLILVLLVGYISHGSARWFDVYFFRIQPSQLAIPIVSWLAANFLESKNIRQIKNLGFFLILILIPAGLILIEPDLGTAFVYLATLSSMLFFSRISWKTIGLMAVLMLVAGLVLWNFFLHDYQKNRIYSFLNPQSENNYNAQQAMIAVGAGGLWGKGLGRGTQSHLRFLPERQTDFIFASYAEEWGWLGTMILAGTYLSLFCFLMFYLLKIKDQKQLYYLMAANTAITLQALINMGMNLGLLPITGVTLPFVSYGGSSLLSLALTLAVAARMIDDYQPDLSAKIG